jgi:hypothetical protein
MNLSSNGTKDHATKPPSPPIVGIRLKKTSTEVIRASTEPLGGGPKADMTIVTRKSINNAVDVLVNAEPELNSMIVCTYPETYPDDGRIVKAHHKAMLEAIRRKFGEISYFTAIEYQRRGAPHFHVAISLDLYGLGEVISLKRKKSGRRYPTFQTVKEVQDWAIDTWIEIISKPDISYNGEKLEWCGVDDDDIEQMRKAYNKYNSGFSWEVMRKKDGAKRYLVKELSGLKSYQKTIPQGYTHPGRHFLYSNDMIFDQRNALTFVLDEGELRNLLADWKYLPEPDKPLFKQLWGTATNLAVKLIEAGYNPVKGSIEALRKYADLRMTTFAKIGDELREFIERWAYIDQQNKAEIDWLNLKRRLAYQDYWTHIFTTGTPPEVSSYA